jgi:DNA repair protein RadC
MKNIKEYKITPVKNDIKIPKETIKDSISAYNVIRQFWNEDIEVYESVFILLTNRRNNTIGWAKISQGGISSSIIDIKIVCKYVVDSFASGVILAHNHPTGNLNPSESDIKITKQVKEAIKVFDCELIDHLIITPENNYFSFADERVI